MTDANAEYLENYPPREELNDAKTQDNDSVSFPESFFPHFSLADAEIESMDTLKEFLLKEILFEGTDGETYSLFENSAGGIGLYRICDIDESNDNSTKDSHKGVKELLPSEADPAEEATIQLRFAVETEEIRNIADFKNEVTRLGLELIDPAGYLNLSDPVCWVLTQARLDLLGIPLELESEEKEGEKVMENLLENKTHPPAEIPSIQNDLDSARIQEFSYKDDPVLLQLLAFARNKATVTIFTPEGEKEIKFTFGTTSDFLTFEDMEIGSGEVELITLKCEGVRAVQIHKKESLVFLIKQYGIDEALESGSLRSEAVDEELIRFLKGFIKSDDFRNSD